MTTHRILAVALAVQAGLVAVTWWPSSSRAAVEPRELISLGEHDVTALEITGRAADGDVPEPVRLVKSDTGWVVESLYGYPADPTQVSDLLGELLDLRVRAPVATQTTSHAALEVADDTFTRKVRLEGGSAPVDLFVGAARGQSAHVRRGDEPLVYAVRGLSAWGVADTGERWIDTSWVDVDREQVTTFALANAHGAFTLERGPDGWSVLGSEQPLDDEAVDELARELLDLRIRAPVAAAARPEHGLDGSVRVSWTLSDGDGTSTGAYEVGAVEDGSAFARKDGSAHVVELAASAVERAREARLDDLLASEPPAP